VKRRSSNAAFQGDDKAIQTNAEPALAKSKLADQQDRVGRLEAKNAALQNKLDEIDDIIECDDPESLPKSTSQRSRMSSRTGEIAIKQSKSPALSRLPLSGNVQFNRLGCWRGGKAAISTGLKCTATPILQS